MVFGRLPEPGRTKTRLIPGLGAEGAALLYQAFLDDAMAVSQRADRGIESELWVPHRPGAVATLAQRYPGARIRIQSGGSLGDRLRAAFDRAFTEGCQAAVAQGSDHPTLPPAFLAQARMALESGVDIVVCPAADGGYCLIGLPARVWPAAGGLFANDAPWSAPRLLQWTRRTAAELGLEWSELPGWYDVDEPEDLPRLQQDMRPETATAAAWAAVAVAVR